jgi:ribosomal protein S18 acetylase RimI-like enzyme
MAETGGTTEHSQQAPEPKPESDVLFHASDSDLAAAVQENLFALFRAMATTLPGGEVEEDEKLSRHHTFPSSPMFKGVWRTRHAADDVDEAVEETLAWFKARSAPYAFWWTDPGTRPSNLPDRLQAHGFEPNAVDFPGMAADLLTLNEHVQSPDGLRIVQVADSQTLEDWREAFYTSFNIPVWAGQAWVDATLRIGPAQAPWQLYVGYLHDKPVASSILFNGAGVASVYGIGTIKEARRMGIGSAITIRSLLDARAQGYRLAVLLSTEDGFPLYRQLGFREVDCRMKRYLWRNE